MRYKAEQQQQQQQEVSVWHQVHGAADVGGGGCKQQQQQQKGELMRGTQHRQRTKQPTAALHRIQTYGTHTDDAQVQP
jgi:hypothetical protein